MAAKDNTSPRVKVIAGVIFSAIILFSYHACSEIFSTDGPSYYQKSKGEYIAFLKIDPSYGTPKPVGKDSETLVFDPTPKNPDPRQEKMISLEKEVAGYVSADGLSDMCRKVISSSLSSRFEFIDNFTYTSKLDVYPYDIEKDQFSGSATIYVKDKLTQEVASVECDADFTYDDASSSIKGVHNFKINKPRDAGMSNQ
jgi:hypothetical protein